MTSAIEVRELTKEFPGHRPTPWASPGPPTVALERASFDVAPGEVFALIGPNGAGKTTLLKLLSTLLMPTSGSARILGYDVVRDEARVRERVALVTNSERSFYYRLTGWENLRFFCGLYNMGRHEVEERARPIAKALELTDAVLGRPYRTYSTGTQRKLQFLRAFILDTPVLFLDEPTSSLDPVSAEEVRRIVLTECRARRQTVVLSANNLVDVERLADRVAMIQHGHLEVIGPAPSATEVSCLRVIVRGSEARVAATVARWASRLDAWAVLRTEVEAKAGQVVLRVWSSDLRRAIGSVLEACWEDGLDVEQLDLRPFVLEEEFLRRVDADPWESEGAVP